MVQGEFGSHWKNMNLMHSADDYTVWNVKVKHTCCLRKSPSFVYPPCAHFQAFLCFFFSSCSSSAMTRCPPRSSSSPWTNNYMSDGFSLHHAILHYLLFSQHLWGWAGPGYVKEILKITISPCLEVSNVNKSILKPSSLPLPRTGGQRAAPSRVWVAHSQWEMIAVSWFHVTHTKCVTVSTVNIFVSWWLFIGECRPCSTMDSSLTKFCCTGQHRRQLPPGQGAAWVTQHSNSLNMRVNCIVEDRTTNVQNITRVNWKRFLRPGHHGCHLSLTLGNSAKNSWNFCDRLYILLIDNRILLI